MFQKHSRKTQYQKQYFFCIQRKPNIKTALFCIQGKHNIKMSIILHSKKTQYQKQHLLLN